MLYLFEEMWREIDKQTFLDFFGLSFSKKYIALYILGFWTVKPILFLKKSHF